MLFHRWLFLSILGHPCGVQPFFKGRPTQSCPHNGKGVNHSLSSAFPGPGLLLLAKGSPGDGLLSALLESVMGPPRRLPDCMPNLSEELSPARKNRWHLCEAQGICLKGNSGSQSFNLSVLQPPGTGQEDWCSDVGSVPGVFKNLDGEKQAAT